MPMECDFVAVVSVQSRAREGAVIAERDFRQIDERKRLMDSRGHCARPELLTLLIDRMPAEHVDERTRHPRPDVEASTAA